MYEFLIKNRTSSIVLFAAFVTIGVASWWASSLAENEAIGELRDVARNRLNFYRLNLVSTLERHKDLALALARDETISRFLNDSNNIQYAQDVNRQLMELANSTHVLAIFLVNRDARIIASSNFGSPESFVGELIPFRPYVREAFTNGSGQMFAVGTKNGIPGYYMAYTTNNGQGAIVIKVDTNELEAAWMGAPELVMVTDPTTTIFLTNNNSWRYKSLTKLDTATVDFLNKTLIYGGKAIDPLPLSELENDRLAIQGQRYLMETSSLLDRTWTLRVLTDTESIHYRTNNAALMAGTLATLTLGIAFVVVRRQQTNERYIAAQQKAREDLEQQLSERTSELERTMVRASLAETLDIKIHEIKQPIAAISIYAQASTSSLANGQLSKVNEYLAFIVSATVELKALITELEVSDEQESVDLVALVDDEWARFEWIGMERINAHEKVSVLKSYSNTPIHVTAHNFRLKQVLRNLFSNATHAMKERPQPTLKLSISVIDDKVSLAVHDSGSGIAESHLQKVFDAYFTTKPLTEGKGLGLWITRKIVNEMGGTLTVENHSLGGAVFTLTLSKGR